MPFCQYYTERFIAGKKSDDPILCIVSYSSLPHNSAFPNYLYTYCDLSRISHKSVSFWLDKSNIIVFLIIYAYLRVAIRKRLLSDYHLPFQHRLQSNSANFQVFLAHEQPQTKQNPISDSCGLDFCTYYSKQFFKNAGFTAV